MRWNLFRRSESPDVPAFADVGGSVDVLLELVAAYCVGELAVPLVDSPAQRSSEHEPGN